MVNIIAGAIGGGLAALIIPFLMKYVSWSDKTKVTVNKFGVVLFAIGAVYIWSEYKHEASQAKLDNTIDEVIADSAAARASGKDIEDTIKEKYKKVRAANPVSDAHKHTDAVAQFFGFYLINARTRYDHCLKLGVEINPFVTEFTRINQRELTAARANLASKGQSEGAIYTEIQPALDKTLSAISRDQAAQNNMTEANFCKNFAENATAYAEQMSFAANMPEQSKILLESAY